jgi:hypothetical protein
VEREGKRAREGERGKGEGYSMMVEERAQEWEGEERWKGVVEQDGKEKGEFGEW